MLLRATFMFPLSRVDLGKAGVPSKLPAKISLLSSVPTGF